MATALFYGHELKYLEAKLILKSFPLIKTTVVTLLLKSVTSPVTEFWIGFCPRCEFLDVEGTLNITTTWLITVLYYYNMSVTIEPMGSFCLAVHSAFYMTLWIKLWSSSLCGKGLCCLSNFHSPGFPIFLSHSAFHLQSSINEPAHLCKTLQIFELCALLT